MHVDEVLIKTALRSLLIKAPPHWQKQVIMTSNTPSLPLHDDVIKRKHFLRYWPFVREIHRSPVNSPHKGPWRRALIFSLICTWLNDWVNNHAAGDFRRHRAHYVVTVMHKAIKYTCRYFPVVKVSSDVITWKILLAICEGNPPVTDGFPSLEPANTEIICFCIVLSPNEAFSLQWRHNDHDGVSNHQPRGCLLNRLFRRRSKKTSKFRVTSLCGEFTGDRWIPRANGQ